MQKKKKKVNNKKIQSILVISGLSAVVLIVSTYAWFIGRQEVGVDSFNIGIAATEHLQFSMNGTEWSNKINLINDSGSWIADDGGASSAYAGNTNSWGTGLVPVSSSGRINVPYSRLELFEKTSFTRTAGGFKLLSTFIDNDPVDGESGSYVAFDLFVKNSSGQTYYPDYDPTEEEEIFLTYNSAVSVDTAGVEEDLKAAATASGIENSIRVSFLPIGRVIGTSTDSDLITGISCAAGVDGVTPICKDNRSTIWEPNDTKHNANATSWYTDNCRPRIAKDSTANLLDPASYNVAEVCKGFVDGTAVVTNTVYDDITSDVSIDIYDGFNGADINATYMSALNTFTDTEKNVDGDARNPFMFLAPNSITKIRVYIYLEGNDFDNQDLAEVLGTQITVNFGFTKQQYETDTDVNEDGNDNPDWENPSTPVVPTP